MLRLMVAHTGGRPETALLGHQRRTSRTLSLAVKQSVNRSKVDGQSLESTDTRGAAGRKRVGLGLPRATRDKTTGSKLSASDRELATTALERSHSPSLSRTIEAQGGREGREDGGGSWRRRGGRSWGRPRRGRVGRSMRARRGQMSARIFSGANGRVLLGKLLG